MGEATDVRVLAAASEGGRSNTSGLQLKENLPVKRAATLNCVVLSRYKICRFETALKDAPPQAGVLEGRARLPASSRAREAAGFAQTARASWQCCERDLLSSSSGFSVTKWMEEPALELEEALKIGFADEDPAADGWGSYSSASVAVMKSSNCPAHAFLLTPPRMARAHASVTAVAGTCARRTAAVRSVAGSCRART